MSRNQTLSSKKMTLLSSKASSSSMNTKLLFENTILFVPINLSHFYVNNKKETESSTFKSIPILSFTKRILSPMWTPSSSMDTKLLLTKKSQFRKKKAESPTISKNLTLSYLETMSSLMFTMLLLVKNVAISKANHRGTRHVQR